MGATRDTAGRAAGRVVYVNNRYRHYDRLKYQLLARNFELLVLWISPPPGGDRLPEELANTVRHRILGGRQEILKPWHLIRGVRLVIAVLRAAARADLVLSSGSMDWKSKLAYGAARLVGAATALRVETWAVRDKRLRGPRRVYWNLQDRLARFIETHADAVFVGGSKAREFVESRGVDPSRIHLFHYLHDDLSTYAPDPDLQARLRERLSEGPVFLYLGRIMHQKGLLVLVAAFRRLLDEGHQANLLVVGEPIRADTGRGARSVDYYERCRDHAGDERRIVFWGGVQADRVHDCYCVADVFVHPHVRRVGGAEVHEGWGQVITEAASMSLPIIASDRVASAFDVVVDGRSGFLVPADDLEDRLLEAMRAFVERPTLAARLGLEARSAYEAFVSPERTVAAVESAIGRRV